MINATMKTQESYLWNLYYDLLKNFVSREGHPRVPKHHLEKGIALGMWVERQRAYKPTLDEQQRSALETIEGWTWNEQKEKFDIPVVPTARIHEPRSFVKDVGQSVNDVGMNHKPQQSSRSRRRIIVSVDDANRIVQQHQGKPETTVVIEEPAKKTNELKWQTYYQLLVQYLEREGHCIVPAGQVESDLKLGLWVQNQRQNRDKMPEERIALLEKLDGWCWDARHARWQANYNLLKKYIEDHGHGYVPRTYSKDGVQLGVWVWNQKSKYRQGRLLPERQEKLETLTGWTWEHAKSRGPRQVESTNSTLDDKWQRRYGLLLQYGKREGHFMVPARHIEDDIRLGKWVQIQRKNRDKLPPQRYELLDHLEGWAWVGQDARWELRFELLQKFVAREGHGRVPKNHVEEGINIGVWVMHQRDSYRRGELSSERIAALEELPGWYWPGEKDDISNLNVDNLAQDIWSILFGKGALSDYFAAHTAVKELHLAGVLKARAARVGSPIANIVQASIERGIQLGLFDRPREGFVRAILQKPEYYEDEDWQMCVLAGVTDEPQRQREAVANAALWAKDTLGLEIDRLEPSDKINTYLSAALETAIRKDLIKKTGRGYIQRV